MNVNSLMYDFRADIEAAGAAYPLPKRYYVAVDAGSDPFTGAALPGSYVLRSVDQRPQAADAQARDDAGRGRAAHDRDDREGREVRRRRALARPQLQHQRPARARPATTRTTGLVLFPIPTTAPAMKAGAKKQVVLIGSDYQETKNVNPPGGDVMPNTKFQLVKLDVVTTPTVAWLVPQKNACLRTTTRLAVVAGSTKKLKSVTFFDGNRNIGAKKPDSAGIAFKDWNPKSGQEGQARVARGRGGRARSHDYAESYRARVQVAVITGASSGIGAALARELARRGGWLCVLARAPGGAAARARRGGARRARGLRRFGPRGRRRGGGARAASGIRR